jgi:acyl-CoA thioesterase-1
MTPLNRASLCCAAAVTLAACGSASSATSPSAGATAPGKIVVLGDSLAVSPSRTDNFAAELQKRIAGAGLRWTVGNAGVYGDTTGGGLRRFDAAVPADTAILVLELGANDGLHGVEIAAMERNLAEMIERAQRRGTRVLLCGMETPPLHGWNYTVEFHTVFPRLAGRYGVPLVPFLLAGVALTPGLNGDDEVHPNSAGAQRIAETVWPYLEPMVRETTAAAVR